MERNGRMFTRGGTIGRWGYFTLELKAMFLAAFLLVLIHELVSRFLGAEIDHSMLYPEVGLIGAPWLYVKFISVEKRVRDIRCEKWAPALLFTLGLVPYVGILAYLYLILCPGRESIPASLCKAD